MNHKITGISAYFYVILACFMVVSEPVIREMDLLESAFSIENFGSDSDDSNKDSDGEESAGAEDCFFSSHGNQLLYLSSNLNLVIFEPTSDLLNGDFDIQSPPPKI